MRKYIGAVIGILFLLAAFFNGEADTRKKTDIAAEKIEVQAVLEQLIKASEAEDIEMVSRVYSRDKDLVCFGTAAAERILGWEKLKAIHLQQFEETDPVKAEVSSQLIKVHHSGNVAWFSEIIDWTLTAEGDVVKFTGLRTTGVLEKQNNKWVIVQLHYSMPVIAGE